MSDPAVIEVGVPGWFGKMPNVGDFATRRLPDSFVRRWDRWLQRGLAAARSELGAAWLDGYLVAPIRRFWLSPGVIDTSGWAGLMMPSVDGVGRHFPLTIAQPAQALATALSARDWYRALDAAARQVLDMQFTIDDLERALAQTVKAEATEESTDDAMAQLASRLLSRVPNGSVSVWWCNDADEHANFRCFEALPPAAELASMMARTS
jgi:type VI secretion system protein ImpM